MKGKDFTFLAKAPESLPGRGWIIDSGASQHLSHDRSQFLSYNKVTNGHSITIADGTKIHAHGMGDIKVTTQNGEITLRDVWHVPNIGTSLLSVARIVDAGYNVEFGKDICFVSKGGVRAELGYRHGSLYHVREDSPAQNHEAKNQYSEEANLGLATNQSPSASLETWHRRLRH